MEQQRALHALEPFIVLSKSANSPRAAADLIMQATSAPNTYVFAELLQTPNIQGLRQSPDYSNYVTLLEIFAWGIYGDYTKMPNLPPLNENQHHKLLLLSLLPLSSSRSTLTYDNLRGALQLKSVPALESLIRAAIYANLIRATLDPRAQIVAVQSVAPLRDIRPGGVQHLIEVMEVCEGRCKSVLDGIEAEIERVKQEARERRVGKLKRNKAFEDEVAKEGGKEANKGKRGTVTGGGVGGGMMMEVDEGDGAPGRSSRGVKRRGGSLVSSK